MAIQDGHDLLQPFLSLGLSEKSLVEPLAHEVHCGLGKPLGPKVIGEGQECIGDGDLHCAFMGWHQECVHMWVSWQLP
eukprot:4082781-Prorocentrum_lima.AAC.1